MLSLSGPIGDRRERLVLLDFHEVPGTVARNAELAANRPDGAGGLVHTTGDDRVGHLPEELADLVLPVGDLLKRVLNADLGEGLPETAVMHDGRPVDGRMLLGELFGRERFLTLQLVQRLDTAEERQFHSCAARVADQVRFETPTATGAGGGEVFGVLGEPLDDFHRGHLPPTLRTLGLRLVPLTAQSLDDPETKGELLRQLLDLNLLQRLDLAYGLAHAHRHSLSS